MSRLSPAEFERIRDGYDARAEASASLHVSCYREPVFEDVEREAIFARSWQFVCHAGEVREPGAYAAADVQGQGVFVVRGEDGMLRAFYNVCKHRAHELVHGTGRKPRIVCPYHAWSYRLDGRLLKARGADALENFDPDQICLDPVRVEEFCSLVFVNLDPDAPPLSASTGTLAAEIGRYAPDIDRLVRGPRLTYRIEANWKAVVDNFLECNHCPVAHRDFCTLVEMDTYTVTTHGIWSSHHARAGRSGNTAYAVDGATVTDHAVWYLWPNTALLRYPGRGNFMVWRFIPAGPGETVEEFDFFFETPEPDAAEREAIRYIDEVLQREDIALVESVQRGMRTPAFRQGRYLVDARRSGQSEHAVHHFHGLVLDAYATRVSS